jgi:hypothetical protein
MLRHDSAAYRENAQECADLAKQISDPESRLLLLTLAESWLRLADHVEAQTLSGSMRPSESDQDGVAGPRQRPRQDDSQA